MGIQRTVTAALTGLLTIGLVGACTDDSPDGDGRSSTKDGSETSVEMTEIKGTAALRPKTEVVGDWDVAITGKRSAVIAEISGHDGGPTQLQAIDPKSGDRSTLDVAAPLGWQAAADGSRAVVAGDRSDKDDRSLFVKVSSDLTTWDTQKISYPGRGWSFQSVGLDGDTPVVIAEKPDGSSAALRTDGKDTRVTDLPHTKGQVTSGVDLVTHKDRLVYLRNEGPRGGDTTTRAITSDDGGTTWTRGSRLPGTAGSYGVAGAVSTGSRLIITGWATRDAPLGTSGMTWTSTDATRWTRARTTPIAWDEDVDIRADYSLSPPSLVKGAAAMDQACDVCRWTTRLVHDGSGKPRAKMNETDIDAVDITSRPLPGRTGTGVRWEQGSLVYHSGKKTRTIVDAELPTSLSDLDHIDGTTLATVDRQQFTTHGTGWTTTPRLTPFVLDSTLERQDWRPSVLSSWTGVHTATDPRSKTSVAAGTSADKGRFRADARVATDGTWGKTRGFGRHEFESTTDLAYVGGRFMLALQVASDASTATRSARIYTSSDGVRWAEDRGKWASDDDSASSVNTICALGDGTPFAVGNSLPKPDAPAEATSWTREGGDTWSMSTLSDQGNGATFFSCATTGDTTVITGRLDGRDVEWTTKDGKSFSAGKPLAKGVNREIAHEVDGGLVAAGRIDTKDHVGPVVWFSTDGTTWQWAPVEVDDNSASVSIQTSGDDVYAMSSQDSGDRLWKINEIAAKKVTANEG